MTSQKPRGIGAHCRTDGGAHRAFEYAAQWGADVLQIFTSNPRQYASRVFDSGVLDKFFAAREKAGSPLVISHASYLINLASANEETRTKARNAFAAELIRCDTLGIPYVVLHMGAAVEGPRETALENLANELNTLAADSAPSVTVLLETSAGQGTTIGTTFEEIGSVLERLTPPERFGVCVDTCHVFAAGYDLRGDAYDATWDALDRHVGIPRLKVMHLNDSKPNLGGRVDRHEHIGKGNLGVEPFRRLLNDPRLSAVPCFIETPDDLQFHAENLTLLKSLVKSAD